MAKKPMQSHTSSQLRKWVVRGYDGSRQVFEEELSVGLFSDRSIRQCLQALSAATLTPQEIVGAMAKRGTARSNTLLDVHFDTNSRQYSCGNSRHFIAHQVSANAEHNKPLQRTRSKQRASER